MTEDEKLQKMSEEAMKKVQAELKAAKIEPKRRDISAIREAYTCRGEYEGDKRAVCKRFMTCADCWNDLELQP